ncbi:MAG: hypothetical protein ACM3KR_11060 [Deltaproteobacteria bacterium]
MDKKKCEFCGEAIHINTRRCPFCGSIVSEVPQEVITDGEKQAISEEAIENRGEKEQAAVGESGDSLTIGYNQNSQKPLSNAKKVLITALSCVIPGFGQMLGIIAAIIFMSDEEDADRRSFGKSLLVASLVIFALISICCLLYGMFVYSIMKAYPDLRFK